MTERPAHPDLACQLRRLLEAVKGAACGLEGRWRWLGAPLMLVMWFRTRRERREAADAMRAVQGLLEAFLGLVEDFRAGRLVAEVDAAEVEGSAVPAGRAGFGHGSGRCEASAPHGGLRPPYTAHADVEGERTPLETAQWPRVEVAALLAPHAPAPRETQGLYVPHISAGPNAAARIVAGAVNSKSKWICVTRDGGMRPASAGPSRPTFAFAARAPPEGRFQKNGLMARGETRIHYVTIT